MSTGPDPVRKTSSGTRVLVVDDCPHARTIVSTILSAAGLSVHEAGDGIEAFDALMREDFALIVTDLQMPNLDGFGLLSAVAVLPAYRRPPVIVLSGSIGRSALVGRLEIQHAAAVLAKPAMARTLLPAVADVLINSL